MVILFVVVVAEDKSKEQHWSQWHRASDHSQTACTALGTVAVFIALHHTCRWNKYSIV